MARGNPNGTTLSDCLNFPDEPKSFRYRLSWKTGTS